MQLRALHYIDHTFVKGWPEKLAKEVFVGIPFGSLMAMYHISYVCFTLFIMFDFGFSSVVLYSYIGFTVIEVVVSSTLFVVLQKK